MTQKNDLAREMMETVASDVSRIVRELDDFYPDLHPWLQKRVLRSIETLRQEADLLETILIYDRPTTGLDGEL